MFEDHWYQHSTHTPAPAEPPKLRRQDSFKNQNSSSRPSLERTPEVLQRKSLEVKRRHYPDPPKAQLPRRPKSLNDLSALVHDDFILPGEAAKRVVNGNENLVLPKRPKSRNDLEEERLARYGVGQGGKGRKGKGTGVNISGIKDELDFANWYGEFEDELEDANNDEYRLFHATLVSHLNTCNSLLATTDSTLAILSDLQTSFQTVDSQTSTFQSSCSNLLDTQNHLQSLADSIVTALHPFTELEQITRLLSRPGSDFVKTPAFREMLAKLDYCLDWMNNPAHRSFRDVENYGPKFRQCMTRALTLIRNYFVANVKEVANDVTGRIKERQMNDTTQSALLYAKFRVNAPMLRELVGEIEKRCTHEEYISLLNECYSCFSSVRQKLVVPLVAKKMSELEIPGSSTSKDLVAFARSGISFVKSICLDEFELFHAYFSGERGDGEVYNFLETICEPLYDYIRPRIIHEIQLVKLCELCSLLQTLYMRDLEDPELDPYDRSQLDFGQLIQATLHDTQTRIVFRAQAVIRDEIEGFIPKPEHLDYPENNKRSRSRNDSAAVAPETPTITEGPVIPEKMEGAGGIFDTEAVFKGWYPTLRKCIWLLSRIYRLVNSTIFDDLAHNVVHITTTSLLKASQQITTRKSLSDGFLFLIQHLLLLKSQIVAFDIEFVKPDINIDFSAVTGTFWEWREKGTGIASLFSPDGLMKLVKGAAMPRVVENMLDAKVELDARLREAINGFTSLWAEKMVEGIRGPSNRLAAAEREDPAAVVREGVEREIAKLRESLAEYLEDTRTRETLVGAVQELVIQAYESYYEETFASGSTRPPQGVEAWDVEMFVRWSNDVFAVGRGILGYDGSGDSEDDEGSPGVSRSGSI